MRTTFLITVLFCFTTVKGQTMLPGSFLNLQPADFSNNLHNIDGVSQKKWFFSRYTGISTGVTFFNGGHATLVTMPMSLQLNRRLNNNWYAFANVAVAPAYTNFSRSFLTGTYNKPWQRNGFNNANGFGAYSAASLGLMYVNENKTFSISGSIGVEKSSYPVLGYYPPNTTKPKPGVSARR